MKFFFSTFLFCFFLSTLGCEYSGTDTGNPGSPDMSADQPTYEDIPNNSETQTFVSLLISTTCQKLESCGDLGSSNCQESWNVLTDIDTELGLEVGEFENLFALHEGLIQGSISTSSEVNEDTCLAEIEGLTCSAPEVMAAFDESEENPYINGAALLPTSCADVFANSP